MLGRLGSYIRELLPERTEGLGDLSHRSASREGLLDLLALVLGEEHVANLQGHHMSAQWNWSCQVRGPQRVRAARGVGIARSPRQDIHTGDSQVSMDERDGWGLTRGFFSPVFLATPPLA